MTGIGVTSQVPSALAADKVLLEAQLKQDFGRIILTFSALPKYKVRVTNGVLIVQFEQPVDIDIRQVARKLSDYVIIGRLDPDSKALRFALAQPIKINTIEAGEMLFIDIMPKKWVGLPPGLPREVIAELERRAKALAKKTRLEEMHEALKNSKYTANVRVAEYPTFTRIQFDWNKQVGAALSRKGDEVSVLFDQLAKLNIGRIKADPPQFVKSSSSALTNDGLKVMFKIQPRSDVRGFRENKAYVLDIIGDPALLTPKEKIARKLRGQKQKLDAKKAEQIIIKAKRPEPSIAKDEKMPLPPKQTQAGVKGDKQPKNKAVPKPKEAEKPPAMPAKALVEIKTRKLDHNGVSDGIAGIDAPPKTSLSKKVVEAEIKMVIAQTKLKAAKKPVAKIDKLKITPGETKKAQALPPGQAVKSDVKDKQVSSAESKKAEKSASSAKAVTNDKDPKLAKAPVQAANLTPLKVKSETLGTSLRLSFAFEGQVPAAVFTRAKTLWIVFDTPRPIDFSAVREMKPSHLAAVKIDRGKTHQILKLKLILPYLTVAKQVGNAWHVEVGDLVVDRVASVKLNRGLRTDGRAKVSIALKKAGKVHWISDGVVGDTLSVVTALGPVNGMAKRQKLVDFTALATAHGLAIQPHTDNLDIRLVENEVLVTRQEGLTISSSGIHQFGKGQRAVADQTRPGFIDFKNWGGKNLNEFAKRTHSIEDTILGLPDKQSIGPRFELARMFMARLLNIEALGHMKRIIEIDDQIEKDPVFQAMRGVANLMIYRLAKARKDLMVDGLQKDIDAALWRGLLNAREGRWREAQLAFFKGDPVLKNYPTEIKAMFRLAAARAALGTNDMSAARFNLDAMPKEKLLVKYRAEANVLRGRFWQALGRHDDAVTSYNMAIQTNDHKAESEARYYKALLQFRLGRLPLVKAIEELHAVSLIWRGDILELKVLQKLAQLQVDHNQYRDSLRTMTTAVKAYPKVKLTRSIQEKMVQVFEDLFLRGKADQLPPVKALGLYYDYRELTPVGRRGDQMIRQLADRLISVDLLDQASEILSHQVDKRLIGSARAQVAAKLAMVHLLNIKPRDALKVLRQSRVAVLPKTLLRERLLLEARALSELGRAQPAVDLLANEEGRDVALLRAEALWHGKKWQKAGEAYEALLGDVWKGDKPIPGPQRLNVLRAAIAYSFSKDKLSMARFRTKFARKMLQSPDQKSFDVVTQSFVVQGAEFRELAKEIAAVNSLEGFLAEIRKRFKETESQVAPAG